MSINLSGNLDLSQRPRVLKERESSSSIGINDIDPVSRLLPYKKNNIYRFRKALEKHNPAKTYLFGLSIPYVSLDLVYLCAATSVPEMATNPLTFDVGTMKLSIASTVSYEIGRAHV
jgi:hypothetical protein